MTTKNKPLLWFSFLLSICVIQPALTEANQQPNRETQAPQSNKPLSFFESAFRKEADKGAYLQFDRFWERWNFITTRYRKDIQESRYVFANDIALAALKNRTLPFPEGAAFGKIAYRMGNDPAFPNSEVPELFTRLQIMVKDSARYATTDGWGYYLLLNAKANAIPTIEANQELASACHACHKIVPERDFVFSLSPFYADGSPTESHKGLFKKSFQEVKFVGLSQEVKDALTHFRDIKFPESIQLQAMELFAGSIAEGMPVLAQFALADWKDRKAFILSDPRTNQVIAAIGSEPPAAQAATCPQAVTLVTTYTRGPAITSREAITEGRPTNVKRWLVCQGKVQLLQDEPLYHSSGSSK